LIYFFADCTFEETWANKFTKKRACQVF